MNGSQPIGRTQDESASRRSTRRHRERALRAREMLDDEVRVDEIERAAGRTSSSRSARANSSTSGFSRPAARRSSTPTRRRCDRGRTDRAALVVALGRIALSSAPSRRRPPHRPWSVSRRALASRAYPRRRTGRLSSTLVPLHARRRKRNAALVRRRRPARARRATACASDRPSSSSTAGRASYDHSYFKPDFARLARGAGRLPRSAWTWPLGLGTSRATGATRSAPTTSALSATPLGIARPIVFGHSMGGWIVACSTARGTPVMRRAHPAVDDGALRPRATRRGLPPRRRRRGRRIARRDYGRRRGRPRRVGPLLRRLRPERTRRGAARPADPEPESASAGWSCSESSTSSTSSSRIDPPTLVCVGELEPVTPVEASREIVDALPERHRPPRDLPGAGHFPWLDIAELYWPSSAASCARQPLRRRP